MITKHTHHTSPFIRPVVALGDIGLYIIIDLGRMGLFLFSSLAGLFKGPFRLQEVVRQLRFIGAGSLGIIFFTALASGMVLGLQGYYSLHNFGAEGMLGTAVAMTIVMELGPILTALMVTARVGSAMCAEIGIMRISEQIDALECMAVDPFGYLISPKVLAVLISVPLLSAFFNVVALFGGYLAGVSLMGVSSGSYIQGMMQGVTNHELQLGMIKSFVFALLIVWICAGRGYLVHQIRGAGFGAESVSRVTTQAVVFSSVAILIFNYLLTAVLL